MAYCLLTILLIPALSAGQFLQPPTNKQPIEGSRLTIPCISSEGVFTFWEKGGERIDTSNPHFTMVPDSNSGNNATLIIESANHTLHTGQYTCITIFGNSSHAYAEFNITVQYLGTDIDIQLLPNSTCPKELAVGCDIQLECFPPSGYPEVRVSWYKNGVKLRQLAFLQIDFSHSKRVLTIHNATYEDSGLYQCRATSDLGLVRSSELVAVQVKDEERHFRFRDGVSHVVVSVNEGTGLTLECAVEDGIGTVTFQWQREGDVGEGREDINRRDIITFTANSSLLLFDKVASDDSRLYFCVARDFLSEMTKVFNVSVKVRIAIVQGPPSEVVVYEGQSARFDCVASGSPPPAVIWLFERSVISLLPDSGLQDLNNGSLFIPHLSPEHAGQYMCVLELPPVDYHAFTVIVVPLSSPRPSMRPPRPSMRPTLLPRKVASTPFTIGSLSQPVSIVLMALCGVAVLLLFPVVLLTIFFCCCYRVQPVSTKTDEGVVDEEEEEEEEEEARVAVCREQAMVGKFLNHNMEAMDTEMVELPSALREDMPHYEEVCHRSLPRMPTFSSDTSGEMTETVVSAATDTHLVS